VGDEPVELEADGATERVTNRATQPVVGAANRRTEGTALVGADRPPRGARPRSVEVVVGGWRFELEVEDAGQAELRERARRDEDGRSVGGPVEVRAIIPGRVVSVLVSVGDRVPAGGHLLVLEAMKMQNELRAPVDGVVVRVAVNAGLTVDRGDLLLVLEAPSADAGPSAEGHR
jgi:biotin carboxyl carrier protein